MFKRLQFVVVLLLLSTKIYASGLPDKLLNLPIELTSGETTSLAEFKGKKPVYIKFWATWCQPCLKEMPHFQHVQQDYGDQVEVISINVGINDELADVEKVAKQFGLTMPTAIDKSGDIAQAFRFIGTPYHLLFDKEMNLIHRGHKANESLDNKLALVSQVKPVQLLDATDLNENESPLAIDLNDGKPHALFFTATWCDWYLKDSRPQYSKNCIAAQQQVNQLVKLYPSIKWQGVISRLWTGEKDLKDYQKKYAISHAIAVDNSNGLFNQFKVQDFPTLLIVRNGKVLFKASNEFDTDSIKEALAQL